jgi:Cu(I)/Ag(I) efflux system membrane fusion protein
MVVYGPGIREGTAVHKRRTVIKLPNLSRMEVKTTVHESQVNSVKPGTPATVWLNARPHLSYRGSVQSVALLPDQSRWLESDVKTYEVIVTIDQDIEFVRPGMMAVVEIDVVRLADIVMVPTEAVSEIAGDDWVYVEDGGAIERRLIRLGASDDQYCEVLAGLDEGERVIVNAMEIRGDEKTL